MSPPLLRGPAKGEEAIGGVPDAMMSILKKADYEVGLRTCRIQLTQV
jgi:hypothetical protein